MSRRSVLSFFGLSIVAFGSLGLVGCGGADADSVDEESADVSKTVYADLNQVLTGADKTNWVNLQSRLVNDFANICGDTFCGGDFSNWQTIGLECVASKNTKKMSQCMWTFGASVEYVNGSSAKVTSDVRVVTCPIPVKGTATAFIAALTVSPTSPAIQQVVPGGTKLMYDYVSDCFEGVTPNPPPTPTKTQTYSSAASIASDNDPDSFFPGVGNMDGEFASACSGTFCSGDTSEIVALGFTCAVSKAGNVKGCGWSFAGSTTTIGAYGVITAHPKTWTCALPFSGKAGALSTFINSSDPYDTTLPGGAVSPSTAIANCL